MISPDNKKRVTLFLPLSKCITHLKPPLCTAYILSFLSIQNNSSFFSKVFLQTIPEPSILLDKQSYFILQLTQGILSSVTCDII